MSQNSPLIISVELDQESKEKLFQLRQIRLDLALRQLDNLKNTISELVAKDYLEDDFIGDTLSLYRLKNILEEKVAKLTDPALDESHLLFEEISMLADLAEA